MSPEKCMISGILSAGSAMNAGNFDGNSSLGSGEAIDAYLLETRRRMERLAAVSGGRVLYGDTPKDAVSIFNSLHDKLGLGTYNLEFSPTEPLPDGAYHRVEVRVGNPNLRVSQSLNGYNSR
jgi:hypothetical protein